MKPEVSLRTAILCTNCKKVLNSNDDIFATSCGHLYHAHCLSECYARSSKCPQCKTHNPSRFKMCLEFDEAPLSWEKHKKTIELQDVLKGKNSVIADLERKYKNSLVSVQKRSARLKEFHDELNNRELYKHEECPSLKVKSDKNETNCVPNAENKNSQVNNAGNNAPVEHAGCTRKKKKHLIKNSNKSWNSMGYSNQPVDPHMVTIHSYNVGNFNDKLNDRNVSDLQDRMESLELRNTGKNHPIHSVDQLGYHNKNLNLWDLAHEGISKPIGETASDQRFGSKDLRNLTENPNKSGTEIEQWNQLVDPHMVANRNYSAEGFYREINNRNIAFVLQDRMAPFELPNSNKKYSSNFTGHLGYNNKNIVNVWGHNYKEISNPIGETASDKRVYMQNLQKPTENAHNSKNNDYEIGYWDNQYALPVNPNMVIHNFRIEELQKYNLKNIIIYLFSKTNLNLSQSEIIRVFAHQDNASYASIYVAIKNEHYKNAFMLRKECLRQYPDLRHLEIELLTSGHFQTN